MNIKNSKIGTRLSMGFDLMVVLLVGVGLMSISNMKLLSGLTAKLYKHPCAVTWRTAI